MTINIFESLVSLFGRKGMMLELYYCSGNYSDFISSYDNSAESKATCEHKSPLILSETKDTEFSFTYNVAWAVRKYSAILCQLNSYPVLHSHQQHHGYAPLYPRLHIMVLTSLS